MSYKIAKYKDVDINEGKVVRKYVCEDDMCTGCKACVATCTMGAIFIKDSLDSLNAVIDTGKCIECKKCYSVCPNNKEIDLKAPLSWHQGWAMSEDDRNKSSSGGFATILAKKFLSVGGLVVGCTFEQGDFVFKVAQTAEEIELFRGSKYVKSNPAGIYEKVKLLLSEKKKVLFIGLPCQVAAVKKYLGNKLQEDLYTVDLICHGTPSKKILERYLQQYNIKINQVERITFREKNKYMLRVDGETIYHPNIQDEYMTTFLDGINFTENCYSCKYATNKRVGDITIGDSWGSELSQTEVKKGISLVLCQTRKGEELLKDLPFHLEKVDIEVARKNNRQLNNPTSMSKERKYFFIQLKKGKKYNFIVARLYPKMFVKNFIKRMVYKNKEY